MARIELLYDQMKQNQKPTTLTYYNTQLSFNFRKNYPMFFGPAPPSAIHSFEQVGICDPYKQELGSGKVLRPKVADDLVYPKERYHRPRQSPRCIYFPTRQLMLKIMRACVDVKTESDLWYNR